MSELAFVQPERRSLLVPILLALATLVAVFFIASHFFPSDAIETEHIRTDALPTHTVYKSQSIVLGPDQAQDVLFVATTLRIKNKLRAPIFLDDFTLTLTNLEGAELTAKAIQKQDLASVKLSFPALRLLAVTPLLRETSIKPGETAEGTLLFSLQVPQSTWDTRKSGTIQIDLYHQPSGSLIIPKP